MPIEFNIDLSGLNDMIEHIQEEVVDIMPRIANEIVKYSNDSFDSKSWDGVQWPNKYNKSNLLINSGNLRRSVRMSDYDLNSCTVISDTDYSAIHNEGGQIPATESMIKFAWAKWYETNDDKWKWTALKLKKDGYVFIEKTQFLGESNELVNNIEEMLIKYIGI